MSNRSKTDDVFARLLEEIDATDDNLDSHQQSTAPAKDGADIAEESTDDENHSDDSEDEPGIDPALNAAETPRRKRWLARIAVGIGALLIVGVATTAGALGWKVIQHNNIAAAEKAASAAATAYAVTLTTVDYQKIDQNFAAVLDGATGEFKNMYSQSSAQLRQLLIDNKAVSHGTVIDSAVKSATKDKVDVLMFVDQSITNSINPNPRIDRSRITMIMEHIDGRWLAAKIDIT